MELKKVICETPDQFRAEVEKWQKKGAAPIIRGRHLIAYGEPVAELAPKRGGARPGSGRPKGDKPVAITVNISEDAKKILDTARNKNQMVNEAILAFNQK